ncbi:MAG: electron transfer flavoprotein subunit beta/FixA family protein [Candidatus Zixiibacteriota bacterium]
MNIVVCLKQVPDTETKIRINPQGTGIVPEGIKYVMNPYDEYAVEEALKLKEKFGGMVTIVCMGPSRATEAIRTALAMGADDAIHLNDPAFEGSDSLATAKILAKAIKDLKYDLILAGKQAVDFDCGQVFACLAEILDLPYASVVIGLKVAEDLKSVAVKRETEGGIQEIIEMKMPAVIAAQKGLNEPRYASLPGIMKAKKKPIKEINLATLGMDANEVGEKGCKLKTVNYYLPPERKAGKKIEGEPKEIVAQLTTWLHSEAKLI